MGEWRWSGQNPIERAAIGVDFAAPFSPSAIAEAGTRYRLFREHLPRRMNQQAMMLQIGQAASPVPIPMPLMQPPQSVGFVFDRSDPKGRQVEAFNMSGNAIAYSCASYTRWNEVWPKAEKIFSEIVPIVTASGNHAVAVTLEYVNKFSWSGEPNTADISVLLTADSPFVCPNVFRLSGLWHNFHGFFRDGAKPLPGMHLENINLTLSDRADPDGDTDEPLRCLDVVINHRFSFASPTTFVNADQPDDLGLLGACATSMHERNKAILRELLIDATIGIIPGLGVSR